MTADRPEIGRTHEGLALLALAGGARVVQYREKQRTARYVEAARAVQEACRAARALFVVNDDPQLAIELEADGLHLGQFDLRRLDSVELPEAMLLGISASTLSEAQLACARGADYVGVGPVYATPSKADAAAPIGLAGVRAIRESIGIPMAAIGGISEQNAAQVLAAGADAVCVISAIAHAPDPKASAQRLAAIADAPRPAAKPGGGAA